MTPGLVSTIIPVFNRPVQLRDAVTSVQSQDYPSIEIIIVDDGSTDGMTLRVAQELAAGNPGAIRAVTQVNGGPGAAREHGRQLAQGEFIQYLDSDDVLLPGKFSVQVAALTTEPNADVAYGITYFRDHTFMLHAQPHKDTGTSRATMFPTFLNSRWWETATPLYRASVCAKAGAWTDLRLEEDWEYDCRIASLGGRLVYCPVAVSEHRDHSGDRLSRGTNLDQSRMRMRAESHGRIWQHAVRAELPRGFPEEVRLFSRSLFLLSRQCGAAGLTIESRDLFCLAKQAAACDNTAKLMQFRLYRWLAALVGWRRAGSMSVWLDAVRSTKN